jgi:hypothetical protein
MAGVPSQREGTGQEERRKREGRGRDNVEIGKWIEDFVRKSTKYCMLALSVTSMEFTYFDLPPTVAVHA